jgi:cadmium resistance protein CadD (predicted permease)
MLCRFDTYTISASVGILAAIPAEGKVVGQDQRIGINIITLCLGLSVIIESPVAELWLTLLTASSCCG